ncbi:hypothetical protein PJN22_29550, partial [Mycobacterium kansasii]
MAVAIDAGGGVVDVDLLPTDIKLGKVVTGVTRTLSFVVVGAPTKVRRMLDKAGPGVQPEPKFFRLMR